MSSALSNVWCSLLAKQPSKELEFASEGESQWNSQEDVLNLPPHYLQLMSLVAWRAQRTRFFQGKPGRGEPPPDAAGISLRIRRIRIDLLEISTSDPKHLLQLLRQTVSLSYADSQRKFVYFLHFFGYKKFVWDFVGCKSPSVMSRIKKF